MNTLVVSHFSKPTVTVPDPRVFDRNDDGEVDARDVLQNIPMPKKVEVKEPKVEESESKQEAVEEKPEEKHIDVYA